MAIKIQHTTAKETKIDELSALKESILAAAREAQAAGRHDTLVAEIANGYHTLTEPIVLSRTESPELASLDIKLCGKQPGATLSSLARVWDKEFTPHPERPNYYTYQFPKDENGKYPLFHDLCINGSPVERAKSPVWVNRDVVSPEEKSGEAKKPGFYVPIEIARTLAEGGIGSTELLMCVEWEYLLLHVASVDLSNTRELKGETCALVTFDEGEMDFYCSRAYLTLNGRNTYFQNSPAFLTEPGTYAYDYKNGVLHMILRPEHYTALGFCAEYPTLETLVEIEGLDNVTVEGITFMGITSKHVCENPIYSGQANKLRGAGRLRHAGLLADTVRNLTVRNCTFNGIGGNGVQVVNFSSGTLVENCRFTKIGMCGVSIGNPTWDWQNEENRTFYARVENNYFEHIAHDYPAAPAIFIGQVDGLKILRNTVIDCAYSAVSVGWNWNPVKWALGEKVNVRDAEIAYNYVRNFMQLLVDGAAVYVLGSNCNHQTVSERFNRMHHNFAMLDTLVKRYGNYGYYLDGSASNWEISDSVVLNVDGMPIFSQPTPNSITHHNTFRAIYSNTPPHASTHVTGRDVITESFYLVEGEPDALLEAYPEAKAIRDAAGAKL